MICYKDKTFCTNQDCLRYESCDRAYTDKIQSEADKFNLPVSLTRFNCEVKDEIR